MPEYLRLFRGTLAVRLAVLGLASASFAQADTLFFSDSFDRPSDMKLSTSTNGMGGLLISSGTLSAGNVWIEATDLIAGNTDSDSQIAASQLKVGGNGHSVEIFPNFNFANLVSSGTVSVTMDLKSSPSGTTPVIGRYVGLGLGFSLVEGATAGDRQLQKLADLFVGESQDGQIRIYDGPAAARLVGTPDSSVDLDANSTVFVPGTLRVDLAFTNTAAGSTVTYNVLFNSGSGFSTFSTGRSFTWSGENEFYVGLEERSTPSVTNDNFSVSAIGSYTPPALTGLGWRASTDATWDNVTTNWVDMGLGITGYAFFPGANVSFGDLTASSLVNVPASVSPGTVMFNNVSSNYTVSGAGSIDGSASLVKMGAGTLTLNLSNSFSGGTTLSSGKLRLGNNDAAGTGLLIMNGGVISSDGVGVRTISNPVKIAIATTLGDVVDNGVLRFNGLVDFNAAGRSLTVNSDTIFAGGANNGTIGTKKGKGTLTIKGTVDLSGASDVLDGALIYDGATVVNSDRLIADAGAAAGIARLVITNGSSVTVNSTVGNLRSGRIASAGTNYVDLAGLYRLPYADTANGKITLEGDAAYSEMTLWPGGDFTARAVTNNAGVGNTVFKFHGGILRARNDNDTFFEGLSQTFVQEGGANIDDSGFNITIHQNLLDDGGGLNKIGTGALLLNGNNTYRGMTVVSNGSLGGSGIISGPVRVLPGATLSPGGSVGAAGLLTINSNLVLEAGSFVGIDVDKTAARYDQVSGLKDVAYAGTLVVSNISSTPLVSGDSFTLFNASGARTGTFSSISVLPEAGLTGVFDPATGVLTLEGKAAGTDLFSVFANSSGNRLPVLTNDPGTDLVLLGVAPPQNGTAIVSGTEILYSPNAGFVGADTFTYTNQSGIGLVTVLAVTVKVVATPDLSDHYQVLRNSTTNGLDVLRNDGTGAVLVSLTQPTNGTAQILGTNVVYTPAPGYTGPDSFSYTVQTGPGQTILSAVTLDVRQYPNFVFILADDQGWTGLSVPMDKSRPDSMSDYYRTPRMETLAADGMRFSLGYAPHPNCSPSRYANLTGQTCARLKLTDIIGRNNSPVSGQFKLIAPGKAVDAIQSSKTTTPELLKSIPGAGYSAAHFGKWHLAGGGPASHGFDPDANDGGTDNGEGNTGTTPINPDPKRAYSITDRALSYLDSRVGAGTPFYLQVSHYAVHEATQASQAAYDSYAGVSPGTWHTNRYYAAMTTDLDVNVGRLLDKLDALGIRNSTYIIYQGDNGAPQSQSENYPLRGYKPEVWEGGTRTPTFVRGPGVPANAQCNLPVMGIDILPTIWEWATGSATNLPAGLDGGSMVETIRSIAQGSNSPAPVTRAGELVHHSPHYYGPSAWPNDWQLNAKDMRPRSTIHDGHYKLVANYEPGTIELYDLNSDIGEETNLSPEQLAMKWQLWVRLRDYLKLVQAQMPTLDPTYRGTTNGTFALAAATGTLGDADSDGLNDDWEFREMLTYQFSGNDDPDHDGMSNAQELAQGTDPLIPNAYRIDSISQPLPNQLNLTWNATPGSSFVVETSSNLVDWLPANNVTIGDGFTGSAVINMSKPHDFFRVRRL